MIFFIRLLLFIIVATVLQYFFSWWTLAIPAFIVGLTFERGAGAFLMGFLGMFLLWGTWAYALDAPNESLLSSKMASLFGISQPFWLILITAFVGGISAALAALSGNYFRQIFIKPRRRRR